MEATSHDAAERAFRVTQRRLSASVYYHIAYLRSAEIKVDAPGTLGECHGKLGECHGKLGECYRKLRECHRKLRECHRKLRRECDNHTQLCQTSPPATILLL
eukprot:gene10985-biopygen4408